MSDDVTIRRAMREDEEAILDLLRVSLGEGTIPRTLAYWQWKHETNPFGPSVVLVAEAERQIVGLRVFMRWTWRSGGRDVSAVRAVDTATHPAYRRQGVFKRLNLELRDTVLEEGVAFIYNTPNEQSRPGNLKMGWALVGKPTLLVRPVRPVRLALALRREGLGGEEAEPPIVDALAADDVLARPEVQALLVSSREATGIPAYHTRLDHEYLRWRYASIPGFAYQAIVEGEGPGGALAIVRARQRGAVRELRLCDLVIGPTPSARRHARALLQSLPRLADVDVVLGMRPLGLPARDLVGCGYLPAPRTGPVLTAYPLALPGASPDPRRLANWQPSIGALELF